MRGDPIESFWREYLNTLPPDSPVRGESHEAESFGDSPEMADELGALIAKGTKTATCSALCIIETTEVKIRPYNKVDARFAYDEGEGDRSLEHWREAHWRFFTNSLEEIEKEPTPEMLVCEWFRVVYRSELLDSLRLDVMKDSAT